MSTIILYVYHWVHGMPLGAYFDILIDLSENRKYFHGFCWGPIGSSESFVWLRTQHHQRKNKKLKDFRHWWLERNQFCCFMVQKAHLSAIDSHLPVYAFCISSLQNMRQHFEITKMKNHPLFFWSMLIQIHWNLYEKEWFDSWSPRAQEWQMSAFTRQIHSLKPSYSLPSSVWSLIFSIVGAFCIWIVCRRFHNNNNNNG